MRLYRHRSRERAASLNAGNVDLDGGGPAQHFHGNNQSEHVSLSNQDSFDPPQGAGYDRYAVSTLQKRIGRNLKGALNHLAHRINLQWGNNRGTPSPCHDANHSRSTENLDAAVKPSPNKHVAREQRQPELFGAVLPAMGRADKWKKNLMILIRKCLSDGLLVLVTRIQRMPVARGSWILHSRCAFRCVHIAPPCDLQEVPA